MRMLATVAVFVVTFCVSAHASAHDSKWTVIRDSFACHLKVISWVQVDFEGDLLKKHKAAFENLIRLQLHHDLPMMLHETLSIQAAKLKFGLSDHSKPEMKRRGVVSCRVWTVGEAYPVATHSVCSLKGYADYTSAFFNEFTNQRLGVVSLENAESTVNRGLREQISSISAQLITIRDKCPKKEP